MDGRRVAFARAPDFFDGAFLPVAISKPSFQVEVVGKSASLATVLHHVKIIRRGRIVPTKDSHRGHFEGLERASATRRNNA